MGGATRLTRPHRMTNKKGPRGSRAYYRIHLENDRRAWQSRVTTKRNKMQMFFAVAALQPARHHKLPAEEFNPKTQVLTQTWGTLRLFALLRKILKRYPLIVRLSTNSRSSTPERPPCERSFYFFVVGRDARI